ncbi:hypothetical protein [Streptococcus sciuri]|uniref:Uncharacterized protein n=1 Tax=Streptococcus sciuri TaxID=2973939 RepID=A0ABT2F5Z1_9STRE|nr:hypothetical protein [Streptococcus sciuri]MCS4487805.1 hypothetical protein [Streptococcus sciuri]
MGRARSEMTDKGTLMVWSDKELSVLSKILDANQTLVRNSLSNSKYTDVQIVR